MIVTAVEDVHHCGKRIYGTTQYGEPDHAAWASNCTLATNEDLKAWNYAGGRKKIGEDV